MLALVAIFLPSFLIVVGALPYWECCVRSRDAQSAIRGVSAAVVGLAARGALRPVWVTTIRNSGDMALALVAFGLLMFWKMSPLSWW